MRFEALTATMVAMLLAMPAANAQETLSILEGSLADRLARASGERQSNLSLPSDPSEILPEGAGSLTVDDIDTDGEDEDDDRDIEADEDDEDDAANADEDAADDDGTDDDELETFETEFTIRGGYDTNYDELVDAEGSPFVELEGALAIERTIAGTDVFASADFVLLELPDLDVDKRFFASTALGLRREVLDGVFVDGAISVAVDGDDPLVTLEKAAAIGVQVVRDGYATGLRLSAVSEDAIADRSDETNFEDRYEDFRRYSVETTSIARPNAKIAPILSARASRVIYPVGIYALENEGEEIEDVDEDDAETLVSIDRDSYDASTALGLRVRPFDWLTVTVAGRANMRSFDDPNVPTLYTYFPDVQVLLELADDLELAASLTRIIDEQDAIGSYARDVRSYAGSLDYSPDLGFGGSIGGGYSQIAEYGIDADSTETLLTASLTYRWSETLATSTDITANWTNDKSVDDADTRSVQVGGGLQLNF